MPRREHFHHLTLIFQVTQPRDSTLTKPNITGAEWRTTSKSCLTWIYKAPTSPKQKGTLSQSINQSEQRNRVASLSYRLIKLSRAWDVHSHQCVRPCFPATFAGLKLGHDSSFNLRWLHTWKNLIDIILFHPIIRIQGSVVGCCGHRVRTIHVIVELFLILLVVWDSEGTQVCRKQRAKAWWKRVNFAKQVAGIFSELKSSNRACAMTLGTHYGPCRGWTIPTLSPWASGVKKMGWKLRVG